MKKIYKILVVLFFSALMLLIMNVTSNASTGATFFYGEPIIIEKNKDLEILSNEININAETSEIENTFLVKNISSNEVKSRVSIKLEDEKLETIILNLKIIVNNIEITHIYEEEGIYSFDVKVPANEAKKIEIKYKTENDLRNAKVIKYTLEKLKGQKIKKLNFTVTIPEEDIPLVTGIYPGCYDFEDTKVNVCYYDFKVNSLTQDFIIEKETYKNLLYGSGEELTETQEAVLKNAKSWINDGIDIDYKNSMTMFMNINYENETSLLDIEKVIKKLLNSKSSDYLYYHNCYGKVYGSIVNYAVMKQALRDEKTNIIAKKLEEGSVLTNWCDIYYFQEKNKKYPLTNEFIMSSLNNIYTSYGKKVCVEYLETEGDKELYIYKNIRTDNESEFGLEKVSEKSILKIQNDVSNMTNPSPGSKIIYIGMGIDGEKIDVTEEEKIEYINMINADAYIRFVIYDGKVDEENIVLGYYNKSDIPMLKEYVYSKYYSQEYEDKYYKIVDFDNSYVAENSEIPTLAQSKGYRINEEGKYVVRDFDNRQSDGLMRIDKLLATSRAKELLENNRSKNKEIKDEVEEEIENVIIKDDREEYFEKKTENKLVNQKSNILNKLSNKDYIVFGVIGIAIISFIISIIINLIKRRKK